MKEEQFGLRELGISVSQLEKMSDEDFWAYAQYEAKRPQSRPIGEEVLECVLPSGSFLISLPVLNQVITQPPRLTLLPGSPAWMIGITVWRCETIAVIDLEAYLCGQCSSPTHEGMLLIVHHESQPIGITIPNIGMVFPYEPDQLQPVMPANSVCLKEHDNLVLGMYRGAYLLHLSEMLADIFQRIGTANVQ